MILRAAEIYFLICGENIPMLCDYCKPWRMWPPLSLFANTKKDWDAFVPFYPLFGSVGFLDPLCKVEFGFFIHFIAFQF